MKLSILLKISIVMLLFGLLIIGFSMGQNMLDGLDDEEKIIYGVINTVGKKLSAKYRMRQIGTGVGGMDKLWLVALSLERRGSPMAEEEARRLVVSCAEELIDAVNNSHALRPLLEVYPFTAENIDLAIYNYGPNRQDVFHPFISIISVDRGKVGYLTDSKENPNKFESEKSETFAEAVAILVKEKLMKHDANHKEGADATSEQPSMD